MAASRELALSKEREDLAKGALLEKAKLAEVASSLEGDLEHLDDAVAKHEEDIAKLEVKLREAKSRQKTILARQQPAESRLKVRQSLHDDRIEDAFSRFEQMERRLDAAEGAVEAYDLGRSKTLAEEIAELEAESAIDEELSALKKRVAKVAKTGAKGSVADGRK